MRSEGPRKANRSVAREWTATLTDQLSDTATELLDHAALASTAPGETVDGRVQLMTPHKGKGLEFAHVFLAGWDTGAFSSA